MADLPSANTSIDDEAGGFAGGTGYLTVIAPVGKNADITPRVFTSAKAILSQHDYSDGGDLSGMVISETRQPVLFVGVPDATPGALARLNTTGVTGTSAVSVAAGTYGYRSETDCTLTVVVGGTIGTDQITFDFTADGGFTTKRVRLGTASSYTVPYLGIVISFGAGTLVAGDVVSFTTAAPKMDNAGITTAKAALEAQLKASRSWVFVGDLANSTEAGYITTAVNAYETEAQRFVYARASVRDRIPLATSSQVKRTMTGAPSLTFADVGATGDTITRSAGSWITDGFAVGDVVTVTGSASNNVTGKIAALTATVLTFDTTALAAEGPVGGCAVVGSPSFTFAAAGHTITRSSGSWLDEGFAVGDAVTIAGTASNDGTDTITVLTATVMTFGSGLVDEEIRSDLATVTKGETKAAWMSSIDAAFASVDSQKRIDLSAGRARKVSPITLWEFRRPIAWAATIREYQHDLQIPCWRKADGPLDGWSLLDADGNLAEFDERVDGGGLAARFTVARTWSNGPVGAFIALSLTRAADDSLLSRTHNMAVADLVCSVVQAETENAVGAVLVLQDNGTATEASLQALEQRVNRALEKAVKEDRGVRDEGPRASAAVWSASRTDVLNVVGATLNGSVGLLVNGTLEKINTTVLVETG